MVPTTLIPSFHISLDIACAWWLSSGTNLKRLSPAVAKDGAVLDGLINIIPFLSA